MGSEKDAGVEVSEELLRAAGVVASVLVDGKDQQAMLGGLLLALLTTHGNQIQARVEERICGTLAEGVERLARVAAREEMDRNLRRERGQEPRWTVVSEAIRVVLGDVESPISESALAVIVDAILRGQGQPLLREGEVLVALGILIEAGQVECRRAPSDRLVFSLRSSKPAGEMAVLGPVPEGAPVEVQRLVADLAEEGIRARLIDPGDPGGRMANLKARAATETGGNVVALIDADRREQSYQGPEIGKDLAS